MDSIPDEILLNVLQNFSIHQHSIVRTSPNDLDTHTPVRRAELARLSLVSRRFRCLAQPLLYEAYQKPWPDSLYRHIFPCPTTYAKTCQGFFRLYLRTILQRPDLAKMIRYISIGEWITAPDNEMLNPDLQSLYHQACDHHHLGEHHALWAEDLSNGREDAEVALLLMLAPNLIELEIVKGESYRLDGPVHHLRRVVQRAHHYPGRVPFLQKLRTFRVVFSECCEPEGHRLAYRSLSQAFRLPHLREVLICCASDDWEEEYDETLERPLTWECQSGNSTLPTVESLKLVRCTLRQDGLTAIANTFPLMKSMTYVTEDGAYDELREWSVVLEALKDHRPTLQELSYTNSNPRPESCWQLWEQMGAFHPLEPWLSGEHPLHQFTALRHLSFGTYARLGACSGENPIAQVGPDPYHGLSNVLPPNLETLRFDGGCDISAIQALEGLTTRMPPLKAISVEPLHVPSLYFSSDGDGDYLTAIKERFEEVKKEFQAAGTQWMENSHSQTYTTLVYPTDLYKSPEDLPENKPHWCSCR